MFSKYFGMNIPPNYSGSRFSPIERTETKLHRPDNQTAVKSSHSPSFLAKSASEAPVINDDTESLAEAYAEDDSAYAEDESAYTADEQESSGHELYSQESEIECVVRDEPISNSFKESRHGGLGLDLQSLRGLFHGIERDELIILALIFLLITDEGQENDEIISVLVLLLLSGKLLN